MPILRIDGRAPMRQRRAGGGKMRMPNNYGKRLILFYICAVSYLCIPANSCSNVQAADHPTVVIHDLQSLEKAFTQLARNSRQSVVAIVTYQTKPSPSNHDTLEVFNQGSGFVIDKSGLIVTNHHVVANSDSIHVILSDGSQHDATIVGSDYRSDLAVIEIQRQNLEAVVISDVTHLKVGQWAFVVGNPYGLATNDGQASFSVGVVSAMGKSLTGLFEKDNHRHLDNMIETDIYLKPGYSGGPMFNINGEVIGIASAIVTHDELAPTGFAIPMTDKTITIITRLRRGEIIGNGTMGVHSRTVTTKEANVLGLSSRGGAMIIKVTGGGSKNPAARAGLRRKDIITQVGLHSISSSDELLDVVASTPINEEIEVTYYRKGKIHKTSITLVDHSALDNDRHQANGPNRQVHMLTWHGCLLIEVTDYYRDLHNLPKNVSGLYISRIRPNTIAAISHLKPKHFITKYNGHNITTINSFINVDDQAKNGIARLALSNGDTVNVKTDITEDMLATQ